LTLTNGSQAVNNRSNCYSVKSNKSKFKLYLILTGSKVQSLHSACVEQYMCTTIHV